MYDVTLLINGHLVRARSGATFERRNPVSGAVVTTAAAAQVSDANAAADAAAAAFPGWSAQSPGARRAKLNKAADLLEGRAQELALAVRDETGSTAGWGHCQRALRGVWTPRCLAPMRTPGRSACRPSA